MDSFATPDPPKEKKERGMVRNRSMSGGRRRESQSCERRGRENERGRERERAKIITTPTNTKARDTSNGAGHTPRPQRRSMTLAPSNQMPILAPLGSTSAKEHKQNQILSNKDKRTSDSITRQRSLSLQRNSSKNDIEMFINRKSQEIVMSELHNAELHAYFLYDQDCEDFKAQLNREYSTIRNLQKLNRICIEAKHPITGVGDILTRIIADEMIEEDLWDKYGQGFAPYIICYSNENTTYTREHARILKITQNNREAYTMTKEGMEKLQLMLDNVLLNSVISEITTDIFTESSTATMPSTDTKTYKNNVQ